MNLENNKQVTITIVAASVIATGITWTISNEPLLALPLGLSVLLMLFVRRPIVKIEVPLTGLAQTDTLILDRPAPAEAGIPEIKAIRSIDSKVSDLALLQRVASLEKNNNHPFALAIQQAAKAKRFELLEVSNFKAFAGLGVTGFVSDRKMVVGNAALLRQEGINPGPLEALANNLLREGFSVALVAAEGRPIGLISAQAAVKPEDNLKLADLQMRGFSVLQVPSN